MAASHPSYVVGSAFVQQYYSILERSPDLVHRFYQEGSTLSRPTEDGGMITVNTVDEIYEKIMSEDYNEFKAEVKTVDAQDSFGSGVLVLVTGHIIKEGGVKKNFAQSFFLAPQNTGFYVLNDVLRFVGADANQQDDQILTGNSSSLPVQETYLQEHNDHEAAELPSEEAQLGEGGDGHVDSGEGSVVDEERPMDVTNEVPKSSEEMLANFTPNEAPKKSYASIVKFMKENPAPLLVPAPVKPERREVSAKAASAPDIRPTDPHGNEDSSMQEEADNYSIYVRGLPFDVTSAELEEEFKRFGSIKPNGIQIRSYKAQGYCFGFVEFMEASAVQSAIEASPLTIGGRQVHIEEKRPSGARVNSRAKPSSGRGGIYRGDGVRGRGYDGRVYGRSDFNNRGNYGNQGGGRGVSSVR